MRALWLETGALRLREDVPLPDPPPGEALVRVTVAGVCNTDLELVRGYYPYAGVPGHEFVGVVEKADGAPSGSPVAWSGRSTPGAARAPRAAPDAAPTASGAPSSASWPATARSPRTSACPSRTSTRSRTACPTRWRSSPSPPRPPCEIQEQLAVGPGDRVVVVGAGKLGHLVAQTLQARGCRLLAVGRGPRALSLLAARGIETATADGIPARAADLAVECTGSPEGLELARRAVRPRGTIVLKSTYHGKAPFDLAPFVVDEITLVGSRCGPFAPALAALARGEVDPRPLVEARYALPDAVAAFEHAARPGALKVLVDC